MAHCTARIDWLEMTEVNDFYQHQQGEYPKHSRWQLRHLAILRDARIGHVCPSLIRHAFGQH